MVQRDDTPICSCDIRRIEWREVRYEVDVATYTSTQCNLSFAGEATISGGSIKFRVTSNLLVFHPYILTVSSILVMLLFLLLLLLELEIQSGISTTVNIAVGTAKQRRTQKSW
jgi:hypothetical protein